MAAFRASSLKTVLAKCMPYDLKNVAKFQVKTMEFDSNLNMVRLYANINLIVFRTYSTNICILYLYAIFFIYLAFREARIGFCS